MNENNDRHHVPLEDPNKSLITLVAFLASLFLLNGHTSRPQPHSNNDKTCWDIFPDDFHVIFRLTALKSLRQANIKIVSYSNEG
jgi:hypothetical protein